MQTKSAKKAQKAWRKAQEAAGILPPPREANGRPQRAPAGETSAQARQTVAEARCRHLGRPTTPENLSAVLSPLLGYALGRLRFDGVISEAQFAAGNVFAQEYQAWAFAKGIPSRVPKAASYAEAFKGMVWEPEVRRRAIDAFEEAEAILRGADYPARLEVERVSIEDRDCRSLVWLGVGLHRLAAFYAEAGKIAGEKTT